MRAHGGLKLGPGVGRVKPAGVRGSSWPCPAGCTRPTYGAEEYGHDGLTFGPRRLPQRGEGVGRVKPAGVQSSSWLCLAGCTRPTYGAEEYGHDGLTFGPHRLPQRDGT